MTRRQDRIRLHALDVETPHDQDDEDDIPFEPGTFWDIDEEERDA